MLGPYDENLYLRLSTDWKSNLYAYERLKTLHDIKFGHDYDLWVGEEKISANKHKLMTRSRFFEKNIPKEGNEKSMKMEGLKSEIVKKIVELIGTGFVDVPEKEKKEFEDALRFLEIKFSDFHLNLRK